MPSWRKVIWVALLSLSVAGATVVIAGCAAENEPAGTLGTQTPDDPATSPDAEPTDSDEPSVEPTAPDVYAVGDRIKLGDEEYFGVVEVDPAYPGDDIFKPEAGKKWVAALVEIEGINPSGATYNPFFFKVRDGEGFEYDFSAFGKEPQLQSGNDLQPGQKVKGWMTFEVPEDAAGLVLVYTPGFFTDPVSVALD